MVLADGMKSKAGRNPAIVRKVMSKKKASVEFCDGTEAILDLSNIQQLNPNQQQQVYELIKISYFNIPFHKLLSLITVYILYGEGFSYLEYDE